MLKDKITKDILEGLNYYPGFIGIVGWIMDKPIKGDGWESNVFSISILPDSCCVYTGTGDNWISTDSLLRDIDGMLDLVECDDKERQSFIAKIKLSAWYSPYEIPLSKTGEEFNAKITNEILRSRTKWILKWQEGTKEIFSKVTKMGFSKVNVKILRYTKTHVWFIGPTGDEWYGRIGKSDELYCKRKGDRLFWGQQNPSNKFFCSFTPTNETHGHLFGFVTEPPHQKRIAL